MVTPLITTAPSSLDYRVSTEFTAPLVDVLGAEASEAWIHSPMSAIGRTLELSQAAGEYRLPETREGRRDAIYGGEMDFVQGTGTGYHMSQQEALSDADADRLKLKIPVSGITRGALDILIDRKTEENTRKDIMARARGGFATGAARLGVGLGVTFLDPLNVASAFVPVVGPARVATALARQSGRIGRAGVRARVGATEGAVGAAIIEPVILSAAAADQADYDLQDSMLNIAFGTVAGGGLHMGFGAIGDSLRRRRMGRAVEALDLAGHEVREELGRSAISQMVDGRLVDVEVVGNFTPVKPVDRQIYIPGKGEQTITQDADVLARTINPDLMQRFDRIEREKAGLRVEIEEGKDARAALAEEQVAEFDLEIERLEARLEGATKRNQKKLQKRIDDANVAREDVLSSVLARDTDSMALKRQKLLALDAQQRDMLPEVNRVRQEAQARADAEARTIPGEEPSFRVERAFEVDRDFDAVAAAERTFDPERVRLADHDAAREAFDRVRLAGDDTDPVARIDEEAAATQQEYDQALERTGLTDEDIAGMDQDTADAMELVDDMTTYRKALEAGETCMARRG
jgi:hypothetical protein